MGQHFRAWMKNSLLSDAIDDREAGWRKRRNPISSTTREYAFCRPLRWLESLPESWRTSQAKKGGVSSGGR